MHFLTTATILISATTTLVAAAEKCAAQSALDICLRSYQSRIASCNIINDNTCLCDVFQHVLVCYNNCPDDVGKSAAQNLEVAYCEAAELGSASASEAAASVAATATGNVSVSASASVTGSGSKTAASATATVTASSSQGDATSFRVPAGAAVFAVLAGLL